MKQTLKTIGRLSLVIASMASLAACNTADRIKNINKTPDLASIDNVPAPVRSRSISLPMPEREDTSVQGNSLWRSGARAFFKDH